MFKEDILKGKRILVTGGGTGLGREMSEHYVKHGAELVICGRRESVLVETANEFKDKYGANVSCKKKVNEVLKLNDCIIGL